MREEALSHLGQGASLADAGQKLNTWLVRYYQGAPHAGCSVAIRPRASSKAKRE
jgi:hypothetical protein